MKTKLFSLFLLFCSGVIAATPFKPYAGYMTNLEDDDAPITVFASPGQNWRYCKKDSPQAGCSETVGWPGRDAKITVLSEPIKSAARDFQTGKMYQEEYVKIEFEYARKGADGKMYHQKGTGYIESDYIEKKQTKSFYTAQNTTVKPPCLNNSDAQSKLKNSTSSFKDIADSLSNLSIEKKADALSEIVGFCPLKPSTKTPGPFKGDENVYDQAILPTLLKSKVPAVLNESNKLMSRAEMIQIDTLARTLYGEMAICYRRGLQYPMAVAKIILNRTDNDPEKNGFIKPPHAEKSPTLTQVCTTPTQFSMWFKNINGNPNETLHHGFCPPTKKDGPYWSSDKASKYETDIWKNTMRIATEAVLYPKQFKKRTAEVDGYFYTSGVGKLDKLKKQMPTPSIGDKKLDRTECMELWKKAEK